MGLVRPGAARGRVAFAGDPNDIAIAPDGNTVYAAISSSDVVIPISTATNKAGKAIKVADSPSWIAITPNGKKAYVAQATEAEVTPINLLTSKALAPVKGGPTITVGSGPDAIGFTSTTAAWSRGTW